VLNRGLQCYEAVLRGCLSMQDLAFTGFGIARARRFKRDATRTTPRYDERVGLLAPPPRAQRLATDKTALITCGGGAGKSFIFNVLARSIGPA
jgi:hypothetical protein